MAKARGLKATEAERELERWLQASGWRTCRAVRTRFQRQDFWNALDILALKSRVVRGEALMWGLQVTTKKGLPARRKRIEEQDWPASWRISLVTHERTPDPADRRRSKEHWVFQDYAGGKWLAPVAEEA